MHIAPAAATTRFTIATPTVSVDEFAEAMFNRQTPENQKIFMTLCNCKSPEETGLRMGITRTNQNHVYFFDRREHYGAVFPTISKCNHSCSPNVRWKYYPEHLAMKLTAFCDIAAGTEMVASYIPADGMPRAARQTELWKKYNFVCKCSACDIPPQQYMESDWRRLSLVRMEYEEPGIQDWMMYGTVTDEVLIQFQLQAVELAKKEGLHYHIRLHAHMLATIYCAIGNAAECKKWAKVALPDGELKGSEGIYSIKQMSVDPTEDRTWKLKDRMDLARETIGAKDERGYTRSVQPSISKTV